MKIPFALAAAALALGAPASSNPATVVPTALYSFGYSPAPISLRAGVPVTLAFTNRSGVSHEFKADEFFRSAKIESGNVAGGEIDLKPGETASVTLVPAAGSYPVHCGHFFHTQMGMHTTIYVH